MLEKGISTIIKFSRITEQIKELPTHIFIWKAAKYVRRKFAERFRHVFESHMMTFVPQTDPDASPFLNYIRAIDTSSIENLGPIYKELAEKTLDHQFNLLGSGWVPVRYGLVAKGFSNNIYGPQSTLVGNENIVKLLSRGNRKRARAIRHLISPDYRPIDWQIDFKSGYRWRDDISSELLRFGDQPGADVKVPWELARLQHLTWLACSHQLAMSEYKGFEQPNVYVLEFRNQVLDFAAANPPRFGVNWLCTMDVAIRAANLLLAFDIFRANGALFDDEFMSEFNSLIAAHGDHITTHLEWHDTYRANHYLANIVGLLYVSAYMPRSPKTDVWLAFSIRQLIFEVERQFTPDGANFEASTSYHRLSAEMVVYGTALVMGLGKEKRAAIEDYDPDNWNELPALPPAPLETYSLPGFTESSVFPEWYFSRLQRMAEFIIDVTKPNHQVVQIGDNDSGRFFKLRPHFCDTNWEEKHLEHHTTLAAFNGLLARSDISKFAGRENLFETQFISNLASPGFKKLPKPDQRAFQRADQQERSNETGRVLSDVLIVPPDPSVLASLQAIAYPDFGLYIWRSARFFLSIRCGPVGQNGNGGHAHNDQLSIELNIDGEDWIADPGSFVYTPSPELRNAYRSVYAHAAPRIGNSEPASLDMGMFMLADQTGSTCTYFADDGFEGYHTGYGKPLRRIIHMEETGIRITDAVIEQQVQTSHHPLSVSVRNADELKAAWNHSGQPFSKGYGIQ